MNEKSYDPGAKLVVLVVDDDHNDLALFAVAVERGDLPILVQTSLSASQAIDYLEGNGKYSDRTLHPKPDVVVLDLKMHAGDGFEFLEWRKNSKPFGSVPVVLFSGSQYKSDIERALRLGATTHIEKPMSFKELMAAVQKIWELGRHPASHQ